MLQLIDAVFVVGIDRAPADKAVRVLLDEACDQLLVGVDAAKRRLDAKHDHLVGFGRCFEKLLRTRVESVGLRDVATGEVNVGRQLHLGALGLPCELDEFVRQMIREPHQICMRIK